MKAHHLISILGFGILTTYAVAADASTYASSSGETRLSLTEIPQAGTGIYVTRIQGSSWSGEINITQTQISQEGHKTYTGTFEDTNSAANRTCTGNVSIFRTRVSRTDPLGMEVTWTVNGGENCPSVGQTYKVSLIETLPRPNASGDFLPESSRGAVEDATQGSVWEKWRVVNTDGTLNCRDRPNGEIQYVYQAGDTFAPRVDRAGRAFVGADDTDISPYPIHGVPWLRTEQGCYVRANQSHIQPVSLPF